MVSQKAATSLEEEKYYGINVILNKEKTSWIHFQSNQTLVFDREVYLTST